MLFSVIIPTYNRRELLQRALDSVASQRFHDFEVIVVDDGSTDGTVDYLRTHHLAVQVIQQPNRGPGAARNVGAQQAKGKYLAFLDSDDVWFPWTLEVVAHIIGAHDDPSIISGCLLPFCDEAELESVHYAEPTVDVFADYMASSVKGYFVGSSIAVLRRDAFMNVGGFTEKPINSEDHDLTLRMGVAPRFVQILGPVTLGYRRHSSSATSNDMKSVAGAAYLISQERAGAYPGGPARARERKRILTLHTRPLSLGCLRDGHRAESWWLYRQSFLWHVQLGRWKYLAGFPIKALTS